MKRQILTTLTAVALATITNMASAADAAAGKAKAGSCAGCHGPKGISIAPTYPNLAGQKEAYLLAQIKAFRDGARKNAMMEPMVKGLSDADAANLAAYFSSLK
ncbi:MAG: cytochrome c [Gammaproteobacteria bacterium]|nr:cytochrome c [Gammaproteobacteria bacterium]